MRNEIESVGIHYASYFLFWMTISRMLADRWCGYCSLHKTMHLQKSQEFFDLNKKINIVLCLVADVILLEFASGYGCGNV